MLAVGCVSLLYLLLGCASAFAQDPPVDELPKKISVAALRYQQDIQKLLTQSQSAPSPVTEAQQPELAALRRQWETWLPGSDPDRLHISIIPTLDMRESGADIPHQTSPAHDRPQTADIEQWRAAWRRLRSERARELVALAREAATQERVTLAWELLRQALREDPAEPLARLILGYERISSPAGVGWARPAVAAKLRAGLVWRPEYGWLSAADHDRYNAGERRHRGQWISAQRDAQLHATIQTGWKCEHAHFIVTTNHSLAEGARLSQKLEELWEVWQHVWVAYYLTPRELRQRFTLADTLLKTWEKSPPGAQNAQVEGALRPLPCESKRFAVALFAARDEYNATLRTAQPQIEQTLGIYFASTKVAYFFAGADQDPGTIWHEATHQLFQETRATSKEAGALANFWLIEGVACYMETLAHTGEHWSVGGGDAPRVLAARYRTLRGDGYVPLAELSGMGMRELQRDPRLAQIYSQTAGLTQFFIHGAEGRYREGLIRLVEDVYSNRAAVTARKSSPAGSAENPGAAALSQALQSPLDIVDSQYRAYLQSLGPIPNLTNE
ncbi:MAG: hypothetical protein SFX18_17785 [Pirellulales bacterium]|nr:hypothetical protein [Pirellulales bacterium]